MSGEGVHCVRGLPHEGKEPATRSAARAGGHLQHTPLFPVRLERNALALAGLVRVVIVPTRRAGNRKFRTLPATLTHAVRCATPPPLRATAPQNPAARRNSRDSLAGDLAKRRAGTAPGRRAARRNAVGAGPSGASAGLVKAAGDPGRLGHTLNQATHGAWDQALGKVRAGDASAVTEAPAKA